MKVANIHLSDNFFNCFNGGIDMALNGWNQSYTVNNQLMDNDHQKMAELISNLYASMKLGQSKTILSPVLTKLKNYATTHFLREEQLLKQKNHPDLQTQQQQHALFLTKVEEFEINFNQGNTLLAVKMLPFLNEWFLNHIMKVDMKYK
jgi:hemerythrin-like metal-binding protein